MFRMWGTEVKNAPKAEWLKQAETIQIYVSTFQKQKSLWLSSVFTWHPSGVSPALPGQLYLHTVAPCVQWKVHLNQEQSGKEVWGTCEGILDKQRCLQQCTAHTGWEKTQLKTKQCYSFKYCIIVFKLTVIHYRHIPLGAEHTGPDPVDSFLLSLEPRVLLTVFSWSIAWNKAHPWDFSLMGITVHSTLWDRVWCSSSVTALDRTAWSFFQS